MNVSPLLISGVTHKDERGKLTYFNELDLTQVKRLYKIKHPDTQIVRAWQAHKIEQKWFYVISGSFKLVIVQPNDWEHPATDLPTQEYILYADENKVLHVPGNHATGFKALEPGAEMIVFSDFTVQESSNDDFRFPNNMWYKW